MLNYKVIFIVGTTLKIIFNLSILNLNRKLDSMNQADKARTNISSHLNSIYPDADVLFSKILKSPEKGNAFRSIEAITQSHRCSGCNPNIAMVLLCTSAEAFYPERRQVIFKEWIVKNKLGSLSNKTESELKKILDSLYEDYLEVQDREGASYNFKCFYIDNCPPDLKSDIPIEIIKKDSNDKRGFTTEWATFEEALGIVYSRYRSKYVHEGLGYLFSVEDIEETKDEEDIDPEILLGAPMLDRLKKNKYYRLNLNSLYPWFDKIACRSLCNYLSKL